MGASKYTCPILPSPTEKKRKGPTKTYGYITNANIVG